MENVGVELAREVIKMDINECKHKHQVQMVNYDINNNVKAWIHCMDCNEKLEDVEESKK